MPQPPIVPVTEVTPLGLPVRSVNLEPDALGYQRVACYLAEAVTDDARSARRDATCKLLIGLIDTVAWLATQPNGPRYIAQIKGRVK